MSQAAQAYNMQRLLNPAGGLSRRPAPNLHPHRRRP